MQEKFKTKLIFEWMPQKADEMPITCVATNLNGTAALSTNLKILYKDGRKLSNKFPCKQKVLWVCGRSLAIRHIPLQPSLVHLINAQQFPSETTNNTMPINISIPKFSF